MIRRTKWGRGQAERRRDGGAVAADRRPDDAPGCRWRTACIALGEELPRGRLRRSMNELAETLESGVTLDEALEQQKNRIPPHLRGLVIAGLKSGRLGDTLSRFSEYVAIGTELERRLWLSLAYPILTVGTALALFFFVCVILVGQFEAIYRSFNIPLPGMTVALIAIARIVNTVWAPTLIIAGIVCLRCWLAARLFLTPPVRRAMAGRLPLVGRVWRATSLAEFCHLLALLLESRLAPARGAPAHGRRGSRFRHRRLVPRHGQPGRVGPVAGAGHGKGLRCFPSGCRASCDGPKTRKACPRCCTWPARCLRLAAVLMRRSWEPCSMSFAC